MRFGAIGTALVCLGCAGLAAGADWLTDGADTYRTNWQKDEKLLSPSTVKNMKLLWKTKLDNQPRQMHALYEPLVAGSVSTRSGSKEVVLVGGVSDNLFAMDASNGQLLWKKHFNFNGPEPQAGRGGGVLCPGGMTANATIAPAGAPGKYTVYAASWDGMLHQLNLSDGEELAPPAKFMPPNGKPYALSYWKNSIYTHSAQGCGGNPNMVYIYDLATHKVGSWGPAGGGMWGRSGPAISSNGTLYTGTGDGRWDPENGIYGNGIIGVQQDPKTKSATLVDYYGPSNAEWLWKRDLDMQVTPVIFPYKGKELMVDGGKECVLYLMDTESIGGDDHRTPLYRTPLVCNEEVNFASAGIWGSLSTWEDAKGDRYVAMPFWGPKHPKIKFQHENGTTKYGGVATFRVEEKNGKLWLNPIWVSRDMNHGEPPLYSNGVVFGYGNGEDTDQATPELGLGANAAEIRIKGSTNAVIYALDAATGKELWNSGDQIKSWNHWSGISLANGKVYLATFDGNVYSFGIPGK